MKFKFNNIKKNLTFIVLLSTIFFITCDKKDEIVCGTNSPLTDLAWLRQMKEVFDMDMSPVRQKIDLYTYNNQSVIMISNCIGCADAMEIVYNCEGKKICEFGGIAGLNTCPDFGTKSVFVKTLYDQ